MINSNLGPILHRFGDTVVYWQGCRGYGNSHGYGYGMGMGTVIKSHGNCGNSVGIFEWL